MIMQFVISVTKKVDQTSCCEDPIVQIYLQNNCLKIFIHVIMREQVLLARCVISQCQTVLSGPTTLVQPPAKLAKTSYQHQEAR